MTLARLSEQTPKCEFPMHFSTIKPEPNKTGNFCSFWLHFPKYTLSAAEVLGIKSCMCIGWFCSDTKFKGMEIGSLKISKPIITFVAENS